MTLIKLLLRSERGAAPSLALLLAGAAAAGLITGGILGAIGGIDLVSEPDRIVPDASTS